MLRPSYSDILEVITQDSEDITIASRYTIVIAAAKRARQLVDHQQPMIDHIEVDKPVSIAVNEIYEGKLKIREGKRTKRLHWQRLILQAWQRKPRKNNM